MTNTQVHKERSGEENDRENNGENLESGMHILYKKLGETPLAALERFRSENPQYRTVSLTYAGRLDPLAEGLLIALSGDAVHHKEKYTSLPKTYIVEVLWGWGTDTGDVLGIVESKKKNNFGFPTVEELKKILEERRGVFKQQYPEYSSRTVRGKPLFKWAREGKLAEVSIPTHDVSVLEADFLSREIILGKNILEKIERKIALVQGDFRQEETLCKWREAFSPATGKEYAVDTLELSVSSGFYVRQFVKDLGEKLLLPATTFHIKRTRVGDFHI